MFGWLRKKSEEPSAEAVKGWQEERVKDALDEGRVERERKARDDAREAKQNAVNLSAARDVRMRVDVTENPRALADVISERGGGGRVGSTPEQIELEDTVKDLLHPPTSLAAPRVDPEPADRIVTTQVDVTTFRTKIALLLIRFACWLMGKPIGKTATSLTILPPPPKYVPGKFGHRHVHVDEAQGPSKTVINRYATGRENVRLEESRTEVLKIQSERAAALRNEPVRKQLAIREQEDNPEQYLEGVEQIDAITLQNHALASDTMSEAIDEQHVRDMQKALVQASKESNPAFSAEATQEENVMRDSWASKGVHPDAFNAGAEEDLRAARAVMGSTPGAQAYQGGRKDV